jgi:hypothetical protein
MREERHHLVPLTTTNTMWPTMRQTGWPTAGSAEPEMGVDDNGYSNNARLEMKMKDERHCNRPLKTPNRI